MDKKYIKIKKYIFIILLILLFILLIFTLNKARSKTKRIGERNYSINIANGVDINSKAVSNEPNAPQLSAGMIPIKYEKKEWKITTVDDSSWYDYSNGKMAVVMLSDGHYISEERYKMGNHELASNHVGEVVPYEQLGTIYVWIPRFCYTNNNEIMYLNGTSKIETNEIDVPKFFSMEIVEEEPMLEFTGVWVERTPKDTSEQVAQMIADMDKEDNEYGLIKSEYLEKVDNKGSELSNAILKLLYKKPKSVQIAQNIENTNRTIIKILNTEKRTPIWAEAKIVAKCAQINVLHHDYDIKQIINVATGQVIASNSLTAQTGRLENGLYTFAILDSEGNVYTVSVENAFGIPDVKGFRSDSTYIVMYDSEGTEYSNVPLIDVLADGTYKIGSDNTIIKGMIDLNKVAYYEAKYNATWQNYAKQQWANIVTTNKLSEAYYTWIPRYVYWLDEENEVSHTKFVNLDNEDENGVNMLAGQVEGQTWVLPDAFKWGETDIPGYWVTKYALSGKTDYAAQLVTENVVVPGINKIIVNKALKSYPTATYQIYVYKYNDYDSVIDHHEIKVDEEKYWEFELPKDTYDVKLMLYNEKGHYIDELWYRDLDVIEKVDDKNMTVNDVIRPGIQASIDTGFRKDTTYYVTYDQNGEEIITPITEAPPADWYDYDNQKWANIVVTNKLSQAYYVYIPRYIYTLNTTKENTEIKFVTTDIREDNTPGNWVLPDAFKWGGEYLPGYWVSKYALSSKIDYDAQLIKEDVVVPGINKIIVNNVLKDYKDIIYRIYIYNDDNYNSTVKYLELGVNDTKYKEFELPKGRYDVKIMLYYDKYKFIDELWYNDLDVIEKVDDKSKTINDVIRPGIQNSIDTGFRKDTTYYVTYDQNGEEIITPITQAPPSDWYDYDNQKWANIVVTNKLSQAYYVYVPRYIYTLNTTKENTEIKFVTTDVKEANVPSGWTLPDAFKWSGEDLPGYWVSKYALSSKIDYDAQLIKEDVVVPGINKIIVNNILKDYKDIIYRIYIYNNDSYNSTVRYLELGVNDTKYKEFELPQGRYDVKIMLYYDKYKFIDELWYNDLDVIAGANDANSIISSGIQESVHTGFNQSITYYVTYDDDGNETRTPITQSPPSNWYDYNNQKWANIVVVNPNAAGGEKIAYFTYIPRYIYTLNTTKENTEIKFVGLDVKEGNIPGGWTLPDAFRWGETDIKGYWVSKYALSS